MTTTVYAKVCRIPRVGGSERDENWLAIALVQTDPDDRRRGPFELTWCSTVTDAVRAALTMRANLERQPSDEVHASRAARREREEPHLCVCGHHQVAHESDGSCSWFTPDLNQCHCAAYQPVSITEGAAA